MITVQEERISDIVGEIKELAKRNYAEAEFEELLGEMDINFTAFVQLQEQGNLLFFGFRHKEKLIGYCFYLLVNSLIGKNVTAENGAFYLVPEERKGLAGMRLLKDVETVLQEKGVKLILHRIHRKKDLSLFFERAGFELTEKVYAKVIGR